MDASYAIEVMSLTLAVEGKVLLHDFDLAVESGQKVLMAGPSGCGKSSLLKCLLGLMPPSAGQIEVTGLMLNESSVWTLRQRMAYVAQEPELGDGSVRQALERPFAYKANRALQSRREEVPAWMERLDLSQRLLGKAVSRLSGGEKQRVALIAALLLHRPILLLDEVTSALDPGSRVVVAEVLAEQTDQTLIMISHDPGHFSFADHTLTWPDIEER